MLKKVFMAILVLAMIGGLNYGAETESPGTELSKEYEGGNEIDGSSNGNESGCTGEDFNDRGNQESNQPEGFSTDSGKKESSEAPSPEQETVKSKQVVSRASDRTSNTSTVGVSRVAGIFKITAYTAGYESTGKRPGHPAYGITASGARVQENHTIAADWDLLPPGTKLMIEGLPHIYTVEDRGSAIRGKRLDIYIPCLQEALQWGVQERKVTIIKLGGK